ncbi:MAG TPA: Rubrerythrin [bacterium]|nr:Rubrerythrin [bacterium]
MPEFLNPFPGRVPDRKLGREELVRALRLDLAAEHEAVHLYLAHADACDDPLAEAVLRDIADEERKHIGEFMRLIHILAGNEQQLTDAGAQEVEQMRKDAVTRRRGDAGTRETVGSLMEKKEG